MIDLNNFKHIHYIKPESLFNYSLTSDQEFKDCWRLSNLQPLWAEENLKNSNKFSKVTKGGG